MRISMWSGPRNLSTAMMYAFANRPDFVAYDEPFYGAYLLETGLDHPMRAEVLDGMETDAGKVSGLCAMPPADGRHLYMKQMAHHVIDQTPLDWAEGCAHVHLIRHPARVVASYLAKREHPTLDDLGYPQQARLYDRFPGPVLDSVDIRDDPKRILSALCDDIGLEFDERMLRWAAGGHPSDGTWASHWYGAVHRSTGFAGPEGPLPVLGGAHQDLVEAALPYYESLYAKRLT